MNSTLYSFWYNLKYTGALQHYGIDKTLFCLKVLGGILKVVLFLKKSEK